MAGRALLGVSHQEGAKRRGVVLCTCAVESTCPGPTTPIARKMRTPQLQVENGTSALEIGLVVSHKATSASTLRPSHPSPRGPRKRKYLHTDLYRNGSFGTSLLVQRLRIHLPMQLDAGSSPSRGTKALHVAGQLSPVHCYWSQNAAAGGACAPQRKSPHTATKTCCNQKQHRNKHEKQNGSLSHSDC